MLAEIVDRLSVRVLLSNVIVLEEDYHVPIRVGFPSDTRREANLFKTWSVDSDSLVVWSLRLLNQLFFLIQVMVLFGEDQLIHFFLDFETLINLDLLMLKGNLWKVVGPKSFFLSVIFGGQGKVQHGHITYLFVSKFFG